MSVKSKASRGRGRRQKAPAPTVPAGPTLDLTKARALLTESVNRVSYRGDRIVIQKHGRPVAALVPVEDLALIRDLEDRVDVDDARKALAEANGKFIPWETVKRKLGL